MTLRELIASSTDLVKLPSHSALLVDRRERNRKRLKAVDGKGTVPVR